VRVVGYGDMPIRLTWISSIFLLVASGPELRQETIFMIIGDATNQERYRYLAYIKEGIQLMTTALQFSF